MLYDKKIFESGMVGTILHYRWKNLHPLLTILLLLIIDMIDVARCISIFIISSSLFSTCLYDFNNN